MKIRLGYVAIALNLKDASTSKTITLSTFSKLSKEQGIYRLRKVLDENLNNLLRILRYNNEYNIKVYRMTSKLVPLATHPLTSEWNYIDEFSDKFLEIGKFIKKNKIRISSHPDHYTLINSPNDDIIKNSISDLDYHYKVFNAMGLDNSYKFVMHIGGLYNNKEHAIKRFVEQFNMLPKHISTRLLLENDDKLYTANDVLSICNELKVPMVLDVHHHNCNNNGNNIESILKDIFDTWKNEKFPPKIHFSSPKNDKEYRSHSDDIDVNSFTEFLYASKSVNKDFDIMIEAKNKDLALFKLVNELKQNKNIKIINDTQIKI